MGIKVFDIETDGLDATKIYCLCYSDIDSEDVIQLSDYEEMRKFLLSAEILAGHHIIRFDVPTLERILGIQIKALLIDTMTLSWYLEPTRNKHGLESYGEDFGTPKPKINDWFNLTLPEYLHRCTEDVRINRRLIRTQWNKLSALYDSVDDVWRIIRYLTFKTDCARLQEECRWRLDVKYCTESYEKLLKIKNEKADALQRVMPRIEIIQTKHRPKKMVDIKGNITKIGEKWFRFLQEQRLPESTVEASYVRSYDEPNANSHDQIKAWLFSLGWKPETFKDSKNTGKEVPQISLPFGKGICPSIKKLYPKCPDLELLEGLSVVSHRVTILEGFLTNGRSTGFVKARVKGLTNTLRFAHTEIVNLPKAEKPYGVECRGALIASEGNELCGADMTALEDRLKQHFIFHLDPDYVHEMSKEGFDPHLDLAVVGGKISEEQAEEYKRGSKEVKPIRDIFKNVNYSGQYGAGAAKMAKTGDMTLEEGQELHRIYWERNWSIKTVAKEQKVKTLQGQKWLWNPVARFWYSLRYEKDRFSTLVQGTASFVFDLWVSKVLARRRQLTGQFHDEIILEVRKGYRDDVINLLEDCIRETNEQLNLNRELAIGIQFGRSYDMIH